VCARIQQAEDATKIHAVNLAVRANGGAVYMVTLTLPHGRHDELEAVRRVVTLAYKHAHEGRAVIAMRSDFGVVGSVRRLEETNSPINGFHPHLHSLVMTKRPLSESEQQAMRAWYVHHFGDAVERLGRPRPEDWCIRISNAEADGSYLAKMGTMELAGDLTKKAKCPSCQRVMETVWDDRARRCAKCGTPTSRNRWQVAVDYHEHQDPNDRWVLLEFIRGSHGARRLTWSRFNGFDPRCLVPELVGEVDGEGAMQPELTNLGKDFRSPLVIARAVWRLMSGEEVADLRSAFELGDQRTMAELLDTARGRVDAPPAYAPDDPEMSVADIEARADGRLTLDERRELALAGEDDKP
jgi:hypothetical protein